jgi:DNA polymerase III subunit epsilon
MERWVVLDVETSGLDPRADDLLAIAAIAMQVDWAGRKIQFSLADSFEVLVCPSQTSTRANVLLHGIGHEAQRTGLEPSSALDRFLTFINDSPLLAFHASFDQVVLERAMKLTKRKIPRNQWVDIEHLCQVSERGIRAKTLDEWLLVMGVQCLSRHRAAADTLATCELLMQIWPKLSQQCKSWADVKSIAKNRHWLVPPANTRI